MHSPATLTCAAVTSEGLLVRLVDDGLAPDSSEAVLTHVYDCADCLLTLALVLEVHGQVLIDRYWMAVRELDPTPQAG